MSQPPPATIAAAVTSIGSRIVEALPTSFLALCLVNVVFIGVVFWFEARQTTARLQLVTDILHSCMASPEHDRLP